MGRLEGKVAVVTGAGRAGNIGADVGRRDNRGRRYRGRRYRGGG